MKGAFGDEGALLTQGFILIGLHAKNDSSTCRAGLSAGAFLSGKDQRHYQAVGGKQ